MTGVTVEKRLGLNFNHRSLNLVVVGMHSISWTVLKEWILFQIMVDMVAMDARCLSCWLYFHIGVTELLTLPARIDERGDKRALLVVLLRRIFSAKTSTVSISPLMWLPKISLSPATVIPMMLPEFSLIPLSQVEVFFSSSERCRCTNSAFAMLRAPPVNKSSGSVPWV